MNKVIIHGRLGKDPEVRHLDGGSAVANFTVATSERFKKDGEWQDRAEWHRVVAWNKKAELIENHFRKGSEIIIEGKLQTRQWEDGEGIKRYTTEILAQTVEFCGLKSEKTEAPSKLEEPEGLDEPEDSLPF